MKRCPECGRDYYDDQLFYCLDDGSNLLEGPATLGQHTQTLPNRPVGTGPLESGIPTVDLPTQVFGFPTAPNYSSIAVLPFTNISRDEDIEYFSDGLAEELLNVLSKIDGLRVAARTSAFSFKQKTATIQEVGQALNVSSLVEGSIRAAGEKIRVSVKLINVADGFQLWSENYDRTLDDIFAIQDDIAQSVVEELRTRLLGEEARDEQSRKSVEEVAVAVKGRASDPKAQRQMLLGRYFLDRTTRNDTKKAIGYFQRALEIDPEFALCWSELGRAYSIEAGRGWADTKAGFSRSRDAALRALSLEPQLAEAHAQLGRVQLAYDWDWAGAEKSYDNALRLAPGSSSVLDGASVLKYKLGRLDEAVELNRRVLEQDPLSAAFWHNLGLSCHAAGKLEDSEKAFRRALELAPQRIVSGALLALVLMDQDRTGEAIEQAKLEPDNFWRLWCEAILLFEAGLSNDADDRLEDLLANHTSGNAYQIAEVYSMRGELTEAFAWLDKAFNERDPGVTHAKTNPRFRTLHKDQRWELFLNKIGF